MCKIRDSYTKIYFSHLRARACRKIGYFQMLFILSRSEKSRLGLAVKVMVPKGLVDQETI